MKCVKTFSYSIMINSCPSPPFQVGWGISLVFLELKQTKLRVVCTLIGFIKGLLPFRYLGVPLSIKKLLVGQFQPLLDKILERITVWTVKFLSYVGRLQLNNAIVLKHLWNLSNKNDKLWIVWVHTFYLKGRNPWEVKANKASWIVKRILHAR
ncbi:hypothetical protein H5410_045273 [Solanum commersonii]|uniref:Uncharacterized protein n=1 Tax=Solanum commersonii TaxID=4109 RepID=A0A9J5XB35_SOLCO|nr:hypothetical protein H5410_045273 [Solanum commersonii]